MDIEAFDKRIQEIVENIKKTREVAQNIPKRLEWVTKEINPEKEDAELLDAAIEYTNSLSTGGKTDG